MNVPPMMPPIKEGEPRFGDFLFPAPEYELECAIRDALKTEPGDYAVRQLVLAVREYVQGQAIGILKETMQFHCREWHR